MGWCLCGVVVWCCGVVLGLCGVGVVRCCGVVVLWCCGVVGGWCGATGSPVSNSNPLPPCGQHPRHSQSIWYPLCSSFFRPVVAGTGLSKNKKVAQRSPASNRNIRPPCRQHQRLSQSIWYPLCNALSSPGYCRHRSAQRRKQSMDQLMQASETSDKTHTHTRNTTIHYYN